jgi:hypothetical protein
MDGWEAQFQIQPYTRFFPLHVHQDEGRTMPINTENVFNVTPLHQAHFPSFHSYAIQVKDTLHAYGGLLSYEANARFHTS